MMMTRLLLALLALAICACDGGTEDDDSTADTGVKDSGQCLQSNFTSIYGLFNSSRCNTAGCHDSTTASGGQNYDASKDMVLTTLLGDTVNTIGAPDYPKRVVPNQPDMSFLWIKISRGDAPLGQMPLGSPPLADCDQQAIRTWITNGANND